MIIETDTTIADVCSKEVIVTNNSVLTVGGICSKKVLIKSGSNVIVRGICNDLEISKNSYADIHGTVNHLKNYGSTTIFGTVKNLEDFSQNTSIEPGAYVNNKKY